MIELIETINDIQDKMHTIGSKILISISAPNIVFQLNELLPTFIADPIVWALGRFYSIEWVEVLSSVAIAMLIIERYYAIKLSIAKRKEIENDTAKN
tara:strand:+ start:642 stop:932 length:291 start_codon:yes stop_codon:yes gene_type:complete